MNELISSNLNILKRATNVWHDYQNVFDWPVKRGITFVVILANQIWKKKLRIHSSIQVYLSIWGGAGCEIHKYGCVL